MLRRTAAALTLVVVTLIVGSLPGTGHACDSCKPIPPVFAAPAEDASEDVQTDDQFNPGVLLLVVVLVSILVATVMLLRQSEPGLPEDYDDESDDGTN